MRPYKENYAGGPPGVADALNEIGAWRNGIKVLPGKPGVSFRKDGMDIYVGGKGGDGGEASAYSSYFKLYDASADGVCKIGVTDGGAEGTPTNCGVVKVNGVAVDVPVYVSGSITATGNHYVWLQSYIDAVFDEQAQIVVGAAGSSTRPTIPDGALAFGSTLLGRVTVAESDGVYTISAIVQDYLKGGEAEEWIWGTCEEAGT